MTSPELAAISLRCFVPTYWPWRVWMMALILLVMGIPLSAQVSDSCFHVLPGLDSVQPLLPALQVWPDSSGIIDFSIVHTRPERIWTDYAQVPQPFRADWVYWGRIRLCNEQDFPSDWVVEGFDNGQVDFFVVDDSLGLLTHVQGGRHLPDAVKILPQSHVPAFPLHLAGGEQLTLYLRIEEIDHSRPEFAPLLYPAAAWHQKEPEPRADLALFFCGIFFIMMLYNLILFVNVRLVAYLYYSLYLLCVLLFVLFTVGPMQSPPVGDPRWVLPIAYLAFGAINIFYFQFGRSFLKLRSLLPLWDRLLEGYIRIKIFLLVCVQALLYVSFHLPLAESIEFVMLLVDIFLVMGLVVALFRSPSIPARFFISGSMAMLAGLGISVLGHLIEVPHSYLIFLVLMAVEMMLFSLGLGYKIRESEQQKLEAERENREAQEALNMELSKINTAFGRFVPHEFLKSLGHTSILDVKLGDHVEKEVTVLFSDIRGYTGLSEKMSPKENFNFLNAYLGRMGPTIQQHQGFVNQYYGDGIMALFLESPSQALRAARGMWQTLHEYNAARERKGRPPIHIGIGLHRGPLMMGIIGDTLRLEAGVVSDTVNTASRMEGLTKHFQAKILFSEYLMTQLPEDAPFHYRFLGKVQVKGRAEPLGIYECFDADSPRIFRQKLGSRAAFEAGLAAYFSQDFPQAIELLEKALEQFPEDPIAQRYREKALEHLLEGVAADWSGVEMVLFK